MNLPLTSPLVLCAVLVAAISGGCGGKPFDVKPRPDLPPSTFSARGESNGLTIRAEAIMDEDALYDTFDANLILAGVLPVRVMLTSTRQDPADIKRAGWEIRAADGRTFKAVDARRAFKRMISYYQITTYNKDGYKQSQSDFSSHALDTKTPLAAGESRQGIVFFTLPGEDARQNGLTLIVRRIDSQKDAVVELKLN